MAYRHYGFQWAPYVPVARKRANATRYAQRIAKKQKRQPMPVAIQGRKIAKSFWGQAWCDNLEAYSDFANRLPRGATYVRNGSVADLVIKPGKIQAIVAGSEPYDVTITISELKKATWTRIKKECSASIDSLIDLLSGQLSDSIMQRLTQKNDGCFPAPAEIEMNCSCPDYSYCCKHIAATMYGVGARLDSQPELLFVLRKVDHQELVTQAVSKDNLDRELAGTGTANANSLADQDLSELFGIDLDADSSPPAIGTRKSASKVASKPKSAKRKTTKRRVARKPKTKTGKSTAKTTVTIGKTKTRSASKSVKKKSTTKAGGKNTATTSTKKSVAKKKATPTKKATKKKTTVKKKTSRTVNPTKAKTKPVAKKKSAKKKSAQKKAPRSKTTHKKTTARKTPRKSARKTKSTPKPRSVAKQNPKRPAAKTRVA